MKTFVPRSEKAEKQPTSRRVFLAGAGALGLALPTSLLANRVWAQPGADLPAALLNMPICRTADDTPVAGPLKKVRFAWNATAACLPTVTAAKDPPPCRRSSSAYSWGSARPSPCWA
jgi:NitT/TauT family transport system substrate-binding protein